VNKVNHQPGLYEVCETYWDDCYIDANEDRVFDGIIGMPYNGWFGSGEPVEIELKTSDIDGDFTFARVLNAEDFADGSTVQVVRRGGKDFLQILHANAGDQPLTTNVILSAIDHHGLESDPMYLTLTLDPQD